MIGLIFEHAINIVAGRIFIKYHVNVVFRIFKMNTNFRVFRLLFDSYQFIYHILLGYSI